MSAISVIIPAYNAAATIGTALESVLAQSLPAAEIIVVDDGSTDDTSARVKALSHSSIRCITQRNGGVSAARNRGMDAASGELFAFLDADDMWRPTMLEEHAALITSSEDVVFSFSDFQRFSDDSGEPVGTQFPHFKELESIPIDPIAGRGWRLHGDAFQHVVSLGEFPAFTPAMMFRRSLVADLRFDTRLKICEDAHFVLRAATRGNVAYTRSILADVRRHSANATANLSRISLDKLRALTLLDSFVTDERQRRALQDRVTRANFDVATMYARAGEHMPAFAHWRAALTGPSPLSKKMRSSIGLIMRWRLAVR